MSALDIFVVRQAHSSVCDRTSSTGISLCILCWPTMNETIISIQEIIAVRHSDSADHRSLWMG
jgi:hypothetical protein